MGLGGDDAVGEAVGGEADGGLSGEGVGGTVKQGVGGDGGGGSSTEGVDGVGKRVEGAMVEGG